MHLTLPILVQALSAHTLVVLDSVNIEELGVARPPPSVKGTNPRKEFTASVTARVNNRSISTRPLQLQVKSTLE